MDGDIFLQTCVVFVVSLYWTAILEEEIATKRTDAHWSDIPGEVL